jgi:hypothetical protein
MKRNAEIGLFSKSSAFNAGPLPLGLEMAMHIVFCLFASGGAVQGGQLAKLLYDLLKMAIINNRSPLQAAWNPISTQPSLSAQYDRLELKPVINIRTLLGKVADSPAARGPLAALPQSVESRRLHSSRTVAGEHIGGCCFVFLIRYALFTTRHRRGKILPILVSIHQSAGMQTCSAAPGL